MAKLILAIEIPENEALKIEAQYRGYKETGEVLMDDDGTPQGYFNPDGSISIDCGEMITDDFDDCFYVFEYKGVEREVEREKK